MPASIPYVTPDPTKPIFAASSAAYSFHSPSHIFSGENTHFMGPAGMTGLCSVVAKFNYAGELEHGSAKVVGGIPSLGIPNESLLLLGSIINVDTFAQGSVFKANFIFRIDQDHLGLGYTSHLGVWNAYMTIPGWPQSSVRYLFRRSWGPHTAPLNSYVGQVATIV